MRKNVDFEATIQGFFVDAIAWLDAQPVRLHNGQNEVEITRKYIELLKTDPAGHTANNAIYTHFNDLSGFIEHGIDKNGTRLTTNNDLFHAVIDVLVAMEKYYQIQYSSQNQSTLLKAIKQFKVASNRKDLLKSTLYKMKTPYYFAQKQK